MGTKVLFRESLRARKELGTGIYAGFFDHGVCGNLHLVKNEKSRVQPGKPADPGTLGFLNLDTDSKRDP
jgi:hypothetical protein